MRWDGALLTDRFNNPRLRVVDRLMPWSARGPFDRNRTFVDTMVRVTGSILARNEVRRHS